MKVEQGVEAKVDLPPERLIPAGLLKKGLAFILGTAIGITALWLALSQVNLEQTIRLMRQSDVAGVTLAWGAVMAATAATLRRWQIMLRPYPTNYGRLARVFFIAHLLNTILPVKLGTAARVYLASESEQINIGYVFGGVASEKVIDTLAMLSLFAALLPFVPFPAWMSDALIVSTLSIFIVIVALAGIRRVRQNLVNGMERIERRVPWVAALKLSNVTHGLLESVVTIFSRHKGIALLPWTVSVWLAGGLANQLLLNAMGFQVAWSASWFLLVVLQIGTRVPALPANIGVFHYLVILALSLYGVNGTAAFGYAIILHLLVFIFPAVLGALWLGQSGGSLGQLLASGVASRVSSTRQ